MLRASYALVQAIMGAGTVRILYIGVAYTRGGGGVVFVPGPAFSHFGEIDPGLKLIFKPFSCRFPKRMHPPPHVTIAEDPWHDSATLNLMAGAAGLTRNHSTRGMTDYC